MGSEYHFSGYEIYPGNFQPAEDRGDPTGQEGWKSRRLPVPAVNVSEFADEVKVELLLPGFRREDFCVCARSRNLQVYAMHRPVSAAEGLPVKFERNIRLPAEVAVEFVSAEYDQGVLRFHLPKARGKDAAVHMENHEIVIY